MTDASVPRSPVNPRLFHFSHDAAIELFEPRPVLVPSKRAPGMDWLNGPLVWAIEAAFAFLYLFPRDCPRILAWGKRESSASDRDRWLGGSRAVAYIEASWEDVVSRGTINRYELASTGFLPLEDAGMWVSKQPAEIVGKVLVDDLPRALAAAGVKMNVVDSLLPLRGLWDSSLHVSGIRLRNAEGWES